MSQSTKRRERILQEPNGQRYGFASTEPTRTKQSFKDECDINHIMRNYRDRGLLPQGTTKTARYGDFSTVDDYLQAQNLILRAQRQFSELPSEVRDRFQNDPTRFLTFVTDTANLDEAHDLGLLSEEASKRIQAAKAARNKPPTTPEAK